MAAPKHQIGLSVLEAVNNLSSMAELDLASPASLSVVGDEQGEGLLLRRSWRDPAYAAYYQEQVKETFQSLLKYMRELYEKDKGQLRDLETQRGLQALMLLTKEAAQKLDQYTDVFKGEKVTELKEFKELQHFYLTKVAQRFQTIPETEEKWQEEWGSAAQIEEKEGGLHDLEAVRGDKTYELFFMRRDDGRPFFGPALFHHLQLVGKFENLLTDGTREDLFQRMQIIQDREAHAAAVEILDLASVYVDAYFKEALKFKELGFASALTKSLMALMLAANPRNLMQTTTGKSAVGYYSDFHDYLRQALVSEEYRRFITHPPQFSERFLHTLFQLSHVICTSIFLKIGSRKEATAFIHMLIEKGAEQSGSEMVSSHSLWNGMLEQDRCIRSLLADYPNGPLILALNLFRQGKQLSGFDPLAELNMPCQMYTMSNDGMHVSVLRIPSPTRQSSLANVQVAEEFLGFLRALNAKGKSEYHLLINLQDRTSWLEHPRCLVLEKVQQKVDGLAVVTLPKEGDFYWQAGAYREGDEAKVFLHQLEEQIKGGESCGFYFPAEVNPKELMQFSKEAIKTIHTLFFGGKEVFSHKNRLDFIEIFYLLLVLKLVDTFQPGSLSFTCKDAVDTGAVMSAEMFAFLRLMNDPSSWTKEEKDFLLWMLYSSALALRERVVNSRFVKRMADALAVIQAELETHRTEAVKACSKLFELPLFEKSNVKEVS